MRLADTVVFVPLIGDTRRMFRCSEYPLRFAPLVVTVPLALACGGANAVGARDLSGAAGTTDNAASSAVASASAPAETTPQTTASVRAASAPPCPLGAPSGGQQSGGQQSVGQQSVGQQYCSNQRGAIGNGYGYELWAAGHGTGCMTVSGNDATFKANWTNVEDFLARVGLDFDETKSHRQLGNIWAEFAETQTGSERGLTYIGIYGWTVNPLREFYIIEDWGATKPAGLASDGTPRDAVGVLEVDGETYDVWKKSRQNKPSIKGTASFDQYFSIRRNARHCGRISVSEHLSGWERQGLALGNLYEVKLLAESQNNSGSVDFTLARVAVD